MFGIRVGALCFGISTRCAHGHAQDDGETALHNAAGAGHEDVVQALLSADADVNLQNKVGHAVRSDYLRRAFLLLLM